MNRPAPASSAAAPTRVPPPPRVRWGNLSLLGALYMAQGLPFGFFVQALPALLRQENASYNVIASTSLLALPWALKFLWAPFVDRARPPGLSGHYRAWILCLQVAAVAVLVGCAFIEPSASAFGLLFVAVFISNSIAATQDIATDALATNTLAEHERGLGNGVQVAGYRIGMVLSGGGLLYVFDDIGWTGAFLIMAATMALMSVPVWFHREAERPAAAPVTSHPSSLLAPLAAFARRPGMKRWLLALVLYKFGDAFTNGLVRPFLVDVGYTLSDIGAITGVVGFVAGLLGAVAGGIGASRVGRFTALWSFGLFQALALVLYIPLGLDATTAQNATVVAAVIGLDHFAGGMATVALFTAMMDKARGDDAGTAYTVQASVVVMAVGLAGVLCGPSVQTWGHGVHFITGTAITFALMGIALVLARPFMIKKTREQP